MPFTPLDVLNTEPAGAPAGAALPLRATGVIAPGTPRSSTRLFALVSEPSGNWMVLLTITRPSSSMHPLLKAPGIQIASVTPPTPTSVDWRATNSHVTDCAETAQDTHDAATTAMERFSMTSNSWGSSEMGESTSHR